MKMLAAIVAVLVVAGLVVGIGHDGGKATTTTGAVPLPEEPAREYSAETQHAWMIACTAGQASETFCKCDLKKIETHETEEQFAAIGIGLIVSASPPPAFKEWSQQCSE